MISLKKKIWAVLAIPVFLVGCKLIAPTDYSLDIISGGDAQINLWSLNDVEVDERASFKIVTGPAQGNASIFDGILSYKAPANYIGSDSFTYNYLLDGKESPSGTIAVSVIKCPTSIDPEGQCLSFNLEAPQPFYRIAPGKIVPVMWQLNYAGNTLPVNISLNQKIIAIEGELIGINITQPLPESIEISEPFSSHPLSLDIAANQAGLYRIDTIAIVQTTGEEETNSIFIRIEPQNDILRVFAPSIYPKALKENEATEIQISVTTAIGDKESPAQVVISGDIEVMLNDEGQGGDLIAKDGIFSSTLSIDSNQLSSDSCLYFKATLSQNSIDTLSPEVSLCASVYPLNSTPSNLNLTLTNPDSGSSYMANEILVKFYSNTKKSDIDTVVNTNEAVIVQWKPTSNVYLLRLNEPASSHNEMTQVLRELNNSEFVEFAIVSDLISGSDVKAITPDDQYFDLQNNFNEIRIPEAWNLETGSGLIAIIDSGVFLEHPDLASKLINGKDYIDDDMVPNDEHGHGTAVAGLAGAISNNNVGISGVSWGSKLLVIRVLDKTKIGKLEDVADAIEYAVSQGAKVLNLSLATEKIFDSNGIKLICDAVNGAISQGRIVVAAAGNDGDSAGNYYPAGCPGALTVGNVDSTNSVHPSSNYGPSLVDIAAPGVNAFSTRPIGTLTDCPLCSRNGYGSITGTSFSAPIVSGSAAVLLSHDSSINTNNDVIQRFKDTAAKTNDPSKIEGRIDLYAALIAPQFKSIKLISLTETASFKGAAPPSLLFSVSPGSGEIVVDNIHVECINKNVLRSRDIPNSSGTTIVLGNIESIQNIWTPCGVGRESKLINLTITGTIDGSPVIATGSATVPPEDAIGSYKFYESAIVNGNGKILRKARIIDNMTGANIYNQVEVVLDGSKTVTPGVWTDNNGVEQEARVVTFKNYASRDIRNCYGGCPYFIYNGTAKLTYQGLGRWEYRELDNLSIRTVNTSQYIENFHPGPNSSGDTVTQLNGWKGFNLSSIPSIVYLVRGEATVTDTLNGSTRSWSLSTGLINHVTNLP